MIVGVPVIVSVSATAPAFVIVVIAGIGERGSEATLQRDRLFAGRVARFDGQRHDLGAEAHVLDRAEIMPAQAALAVEDQNGRRALQLIGLERLGQTLAVRFVERDCELEALLGDEGLERLGRLLGLLLERDIEPDDADLVAAEPGGETRGLRETMLH